MGKSMVLRILGIMAALVILSAGGYAAFVLLTYSRIPDRVELAVRGDAGAEAEPGREYTAVTLNIGFGAYTADFTFFMDGGKESRARSKEGVIECVGGSAADALSFEPDFALFQEVDTDSTRSFHVDEEEIILDAFGRKGGFDSVFAQNYHSAYLMYPLTKPHGASNSGLLTLSAMDVAGALRRSLPIAEGFKKLVDLDRCYSISRIRVNNGKELALFNVHLSAYGTDAAQGNRQLQMLFADMQAEYEKGNYVVCGGDFNHDFTGDSKEYFNPGTDKTYSWCHPFPDETIPEGFKRCTDYADGRIHTSRYTDRPYGEDSFTVILDGFIISDNVQCTYVQNVDLGYRYTDHNPVVMRFVLQ